MQNICSLQKESTNLSTMLTRRKFSVLTAALIGSTSCRVTDSEPGSHTVANATDAVIEVFDQAVERLINPSATWEVLADGFWWAEGPTWDKKREQLYFTDVPQNKAFVWKAGDGARVFLDPSGAAVSEGFREPGANGLLYLDDDTLLLANHGKRAIETLNLSDFTRTVLTDRFKGQKFNSPNDVTISDTGDIYFTDPPYGLTDLNDSPLKELAHNGVYKLSPDGTVELISDTLTFPNGVALSPDNQGLFVTQSDPDLPVVYVFDLSSGAASEPQIFVDFSKYQSPQTPGLPDGLAVADTGDMFITGPGGVYIINKNGVVLGRINTGSATANCAFGEDGKTLFMTAQDRLLKIATKVRGLSWS